MNENIKNPDKISLLD